MGPDGTFEVGWLWEGRRIEVTNNHNKEHCSSETHHGFHIY